MSMHRSTAGDAVPLDARPGQLSRQRAAADDRRRVLVFNGRDGEWQATIAGRKRPDALEIERADPAAGHPARRHLCVRAAEARAARLHGAEGRRDGRGAPAAGADAPHAGQRASIPSGCAPTPSRPPSNAASCRSPNVAEPVPLERWLGPREPSRLLVFCDEAGEVADPVAALQPRDRAARWHRRADRAGRRLRGGGTRSAAAAAADAGGCRSARASCAPTPPPSPRWRWCRPSLGRLAGPLSAVTRDKPRIKHVAEARSKPRYGPC